MTPAQPRRPAPPTPASFRTGPCRRRASTATARSSSASRSPRRRGIRSPGRAGRRDHAAPRLHLRQRLGLMLGRLRPTRRTSSSAAPSRLRRRHARRRPHPAAGHLQRHLHADVQLQLSRRAGPATADALGCRMSLTPTLTIVSSARLHRSRLGRPMGWVHLGRLPRGRPGRRAVRLPARCSPRRARPASGRRAAAGHGHARGLLVEVHTMTMPTWISA
jgi:hypothetical protein